MITSEDNMAKKTVRLLQVDAGDELVMTRRMKLQVRRLQRRSKLVAAAKDLLWLDRETSAAYIGIGRTKLDVLSSVGVLKASKLGRRTIYNRKQLDEYIARLAGLTPQHYSQS